MGTARPYDKGDDDGDDDNDAVFYFLLTYQFESNHDYFTLRLLASFLTDGRTLAGIPPGAFDSTEPINIHWVRFGFDTPYCTPGHNHFRPVRPLYPHGCQSREKNVH